MEKRDQKAALKVILCDINALTNYSITRINNVKVSDKQVQ